jgi:4-hydroxybenzoate polyprenyltransferase
LSIESNKVLALIRSSHPIPCLAVSLFAAVFALGLGFSLQRSLLVFFVVLLQQISVGLSNDWLDSKQDLRAGRKDKPAANGLVKVSELRTWSLVAAVLAQASAFYFGPSAAVLMFAMLAAGWAYNLGMKANWSSAIPYIVGFGSVPVFAGLSAEVPIWVEPWVVLMSALLGVSAHFANVLPDIEADKLNGVRALPHILGQRVSALVIAVTALVATLLVVTQSQDLEPAVAIAGLVLNVVLAGFASALSLKKQPPPSAFLLLILASLVNVLLLVLGSGD